MSEEIYIVIKSLLLNSLIVIYIWENCQVWLKTWSQTQNNTPTWVKGKSNLKGYWNYNYPLVTKQKNGIFFTFLPLASRLFRRLENKSSRRLNWKSSGQLVLNII